MERYCAHPTHKLSLDEAARTNLFEITNGHPGALFSLLSYIFQVGYSLFSTGTFAGEEIVPPTNGILLLLRSVFSTSYVKVGASHLIVVTKGWNSVLRWDGYMWMLWTKKATLRSVDCHPNFIRWGVEFFSEGIANTLEEHYGRFLLNGKILLVDFERLDPRLDCY